MIKILIVEDQAMLRESLQSLIGAQADMEVIGVTHDASKVPNLCKELKPDIVLMDVVTKNETNGITYTAQIRKEYPQIKVVIMTGLPEITFVEEAKKAGAHSFISKDSGKDHLFYTIRSTMNGIGIYPGPQTQSPFADQFTEKEIAVIRLVCQGKSRSQIAKELDVSESVLKPIITSILDKTGFDSITKFAIYAAGRGLIVTDW
jgi:DNA-binding NarL/FixJ family response regulator